MIRLYFLVALVFLVNNVSAQTPILVSDIIPGPQGTKFWSLTPYNGKLAFITEAYTASSYDYKLYITDGTSEGTVLLRDLGFLITSPPDNIITYYNGKLYFTANDTVHGIELWSTDGTISGTSIVKDIWPGVQSGFTGTSVTMGDKLFFIANDGVYGRQLWTSDGTAGGTYALTYDSVWQVSSLAAANTQLFFTKSNGEGSSAVFETDGTVSGTNSIANYYGAEGEEDIDVEGLVGYGNDCFFSTYAYNPTSGVPPTVNLCIYDGTTLYDTYQPVIFSSSHAAYGSSLVLRSTYYGAGFIAHDQLWATDGTPGGTYALTDDLTNECSFVRALGGFGGNIVYGANNALWISDLSSSVYSFPDGSWDNSPCNFVSYGSRLFFTVWDNTTQRTNLWVTDGTPSGTHYAYYPGANYIVSGYNACSPTGLTLVDSTLYFAAAYDSAVGNELYKASATALSITKLPASQEKISIFPNPATTSVYITSAENIKTVEIYNVLGKKLMDKAGNSNKVSIDIAFLPPGLYWAKVNDFTMGKFAKD